MTCLGNKIDWQVKIITHIHLAELISKRAENGDRKTGPFLPSHTRTNISSYADERRKEHTCCRGNRKWQTGKRKAASVSIYSSVGEDDEVGVRVNILHAPRPIACSLSHTHTSAAPSRCAALPLLLLASSVKSLMVLCVISPETPACSNTACLYCPVETSTQLKHCI